MEIDVIDLNFKQINFNRNYDSTRYFKARKIYNNLDVNKYSAKVCHK